MKVWKQLYEISFDAHHFFSRSWCLILIVLYYLSFQWHQSIQLSACGPIYQLVYGTLFILAENFKTIKRGFRCAVARRFRIRMKGAKSTIILHRCMLWCTRCKKMISYKQMHKYTYLTIDHFVLSMLDPLSKNLERVNSTLLKNISNG